MRNLFYRALLVGFVFVTLMVGPAEAYTAKRLDVDSCSPSKHQVGLIRLGEGASGEIFLFVHLALSAVLLSGFFKLKRYRCQLVKVALLACICDLAYLLLRSFTASGLYNLDIAIVAERLAFM